MGSAKLCPETPRQKMINMMYIVLTAMLALNVATEVLDAFKIVDISLQQTHKNFELKNAQIYSAFDKAHRLNPQKVGPWKEKADAVKSQSEELITYIQDLKVQLVERSGVRVISAAEGTELTEEDTWIIGTNGDTLKIRRPDDLNSPSEMMIREKDGEKLKEQIIGYRNALLSYINEQNVALRGAIESDLDTSDPKINFKEGGDTQTWETQHFENKPLIAIITLLSKMQIDIRNAEGNTANYLYGQIDASSFKFSTLEPQVIAKSNYVLKGDVYEARIFLSAVDKTQKPEIFIGRRKIPIIDGQGVYTVPAENAGQIEWEGVIRYPDPLGGTTQYPISSTYEVAEPSFSVSPTKMNVFYLGVPNPINVSAAGVPMSNIRVEMSNGTVEFTENGFVASPKAEDINGRKTKVSVFATTDNEERKLGDAIFRVKRVPDPVATIAGKKGGNIRKEDLLVEDGVAAVLEGFDFDMRFVVTQFTLTIAGGGGFVNSWKSNSNRFTQDQKGQIKRLGPGSLIYIENIQAKGDDGTTRDITPITFRIR